jgi:hypothetical protein
LSRGGGAASGIFLDRQRLKALVQRRQRLLAYAGADAPGVKQTSVRFVVCEQQRAEVKARPFGVGPADDNELLTIEALRFAP